jgi:hypothetical protein
VERERNLRINPPKSKVPDGCKIPDPFGEVWTKADYGWTLVGERIGRLSAPTLLKLSLGLALPEPLLGKLSVCG